MPIAISNLEDLFPDCMLPKCERTTAEGRHAHMLDHQHTIVTDTAKYLYCQGGVGSAKSVAFAARSVKMCLDIDENEGVIGRKDYKLLYRSAWQDVKACIRKLTKLGYFAPFGIDQLNYEKKMYSAKKQGDYSTIHFPNNSIVYAIQTKAWEEGLGPSYGWFWIDDAMESSEELFVGHETSAGLISRLRLPRATFYQTAEGKTASKLSGMVSSNPPPHNHWLHKLFGAQPGAFKIGNDTVTHLRVETFLNPFVGENYAAGLMSIQRKMGRSSETARRVIFGESIPAYGGVKVYPQFKHERHVGEHKFDSQYPLVRSWDFGFHHPAVVYSGLRKCEKGRNHFISHSESSQCFNSDVWQLYKEVKDHSKKYYDSALRIFDAGDKAGYRRSDTNKDRRGPIRILQDEYGLSFKYRYFDLDNSLEYCRSLLKTKCECGEELIQIDKSCEALIEALEGGYKYTKTRTGVTSDKPYKDKYYDDVADAWRYGVENYVKWTLTQNDFRDGYRKHKANVNPWAWMEATSEDIAKMLTAP